MRTNPSQYTLYHGSLGDSFCRASLVAEHYFRGTDRNRGEAPRQVSFTSATKHDLRSITKSITALVLGIALDRGWVDSVDAPVFSFFPEYADLRTPEKDRISVRHLLTMSAGLAWDESRPYSDPANSETCLDIARDRCRYVLQQPVVAPAGRVHLYSGGATTLIAAVLYKATGKHLDELTRMLLFEPLGITHVGWYRYANGDPIAASGLRLRPRDLAKIGQLILLRGAWDGAQIVPASWIDTATTPQVSGIPQMSGPYGYQFRIGQSLVRKREVNWIAGEGNGGQRLYIVPSLNLVVVVYAGLYDCVHQSWVPIVILERVLATTGPTC